jgi:hypothetical protein
MKKNNDPVGVIDEWAALYQREIAPPLAEGEKSLAMIERETGVDNRTAKDLIVKWLADGFIISVGRRRTTRGITVDAWRIVKRTDPVTVRLAEK